MHVGTATTLASLKLGWIYFLPFECGLPARLMIVNFPISSFCPNPTNWNDLENQTLNLLLDVLGCILNDPKLGNKECQSEGLLTDNTPKNVVACEDVRTEGGATVGIRMWIVCYDPDFSLEEGLANLIASNVWLRNKKKSVVPPPNSYLSILSPQDALQKVKLPHVSDPNLFSELQENNRYARDGCYSFAELFSPSRFSCGLGGAQQDQLDPSHYFDMTDGASASSMSENFPHRDLFVRVFPYYLHPTRRRSLPLPSAFIEEISPLLREWQERSETGAPFHEVEEHMIRLQQVERKITNVTTELPAGEAPSLNEMIDIFCKKNVSLAMRQANAKLSPEQLQSQIKEDLVTLWKKIRTSPNVSPGIRAAINYWTRQATYCSTIKTIDSTLSPFANMILWLNSWWNDTALLKHNFGGAHIVFTARDDAARYEEFERFHTLLEGDHAVGKSFLIWLVSMASYKGSVENVGHSTTTAFVGPQDHSGVLYAYEEFPNKALGVGPKNEVVECDHLLKQRTTSQWTTYRSYDKDNKNRVPLVGVARFNATVAICLNIIVPHNTPMGSRFYHLHFSQGDRPDRSSSVLAAASFEKMAQDPKLLGVCKIEHQRQFLHTMYHESDTAGIRLPKPEMTIPQIMLTAVMNELKSMNFPTPALRNTYRYYIKCHHDTIHTAIYQEFFSEGRGDLPETYDPTLLNLLGPHMVSKQEFAVFALSLMTNTLLPPIRDHVSNAFEKIFEKTSQQDNRDKWFRQEQTNTGTVMDYRYVKLLCNSMSEGAHSLISYMKLLPSVKAVQNCLHEMKGMRIRCKRYVAAQHDIMPGVFINTYEEDATSIEENIPLVLFEMDQTTQKFQLCFCQKMFEVPSNQDAMRKALESVLYHPYQKQDKFITAFPAKDVQLGPLPHVFDILTIPATWQKNKPTPLIVNLPLQSSEPNARNDAPAQFRVDGALDEIVTQRFWSNWDFLACNDDVFRRASPMTAQEDLRETFPYNHPANRENYPEKWIEKTRAHAKAFSKKRSRIQQQKSRNDSTAVNTESESDIQLPNYSRSRYDEMTTKRRRCPPPDVHSQETPAYEEESPLSRTRRFPSIEQLGSSVREQMIL